jgi:hypothetical protein
MTDETKNNVVPFVRPPAADSKKAEAAMAEDVSQSMTEAQLIAEGYVPMESVPKYYKYNVDSIQTMDDVRRFIGSMNIYLTLIGDQTLEGLGRDPAEWTVLEFEDDDTSTDI